MNGLSLEKLAQVVYADKQHTFAQERFVRQVELAQAQLDQAAGKPNWWTTIRGMTARQLVITVAVRPFQLMVQWV